MTPTSRLVLIATCLAALPACGGGSGGPSVPPAAPSSSSPYDGVIQQNYAGNWGVELGVYKNGSPLHVAGYGLRDRGLPEVFSPGFAWGVPSLDKMYGLTRGQFPPDANTYFELGSISKEFTAGAILLLQQDGKLSVDDPLAKYFPSFPNAAAITLRMMLQHSSGLIDYNNFGGYPDFSGAYAAFMANGQDDYTPIVNTLATFPLDFVPGTQYEYSNSNYLMLGLVVANVAGEPLGAFLQQRIFTPLGMTQTQQGLPPPPVSDIALGYNSVNGTIGRAPQWNLSWLAGAGGLTSTVGDVEKWDRAVRAPGVFTAASLAQMFAPGPYPQAFGTYAFGWIVSTLSGHRYIWHDGALGGFQTMNATFPDDGIEIIVLTNDGTGTLPYDVIPPLFNAALTGAR